MDAPEEIYHVSYGQLSICRHYGGCTVFGHTYLYDPTRDMLVRIDVMRTRERVRKESERKQIEKEKERQLGLF